VFSSSALSNNQAVSRGLCDREETGIEVVPILFYALKDFIVVNFLSVNDVSLNGIEVVPMTTLEAGRGIVLNRSAQTGTERNL